ncbi:MAG TPA: hypothetical protein VFA55_08715, partial [Candidatus Kapabacteria bacterium]|nr:hypothetical protein [Candidatus Kapabacteria bacterium]
TFTLGEDKLHIETIQPASEKNEFDIAIPELTPALARKTSLAAEIAALDVMAFSNSPIPIKERDEKITSFIYEGRDIITDEHLLEREYILPQAQTPGEVLGYYARKIAAEVKLPSQFAVLEPKVKEFFENKAFGKTTDLNDARIIRAMSSPIADYIVVREFTKALRDNIVEEKTPELLTKGRALSTTPPFPYSRKIFEARKSVFNHVACDNNLEFAFARFLDSAEDVAAFAKLPLQFGFSIEYPDSRGNIRNYYPDFIARLHDGSHWVIETKGQEDIEVRRKDEAARLWCENATTLTSVQWRYVKVPQREFEKLHPSTFEELTLALAQLPEMPEPEDDLPLLDEPEEQNVSDTVEPLVQPHPRTDSHGLAPINKDANTGTPTYGKHELSIIPEVSESDDGVAAQPDIFPETVKKKGRAKNAGAQTALNIRQTTREESLAFIREIIAEAGGEGMEREELIRETGYRFGFERIGPAIHETISDDVIAASMRGIVKRIKGIYYIDCHNINDYPLDLLKKYLISEIGRIWTEQDEAIRRTSRYLGFRRAGPNIFSAFKSAINGAIRQGKIERDGKLIRSRK